MAWKNVILLDKIWMVEPNAWLKKWEKKTIIDRFNLQLFKDILLTFSIDKLRVKNSNFSNYE